MFGAFEIVFIVAIILLVLNGVRILGRGHTGMIDDVVDRAAYMQARMREAELEYEDPDWICQHCNRRNPGTADECESCGAPARMEN